MITTVVTDPHISVLKIKTPDMSSYSLPDTQRRVLQNYSQTCIKRSPLGGNKNWSFKTGDLLKEVQFI